jgi:hypothetical protein
MLTAKTKSPKALTTMPMATSTMWTELNVADRNSQLMDTGIFGFGNFTLPCIQPAI